MSPNYQARADKAIAAAIVAVTRLRFVPDAADDAIQAIRDMDRARAHLSVSSESVLLDSMLRARNVMLWHMCALRGAPWRAFDAAHAACWAWSASLHPAEPIEPGAPRLDIYRRPIAA